ncbi:hypothetical protein CEXT_692871, partial [Caerostris extrusa]
MNRWLDSLVPSFFYEKQQQCQGTIDQQNVLSQAISVCGGDEPSFLQIWCSAS